MIAILLSLKGKKFEDLGIVRDGSSEKKEYKNGYHHTEIVGLTENMKHQSVSIQKFILQFQKTMYLQIALHFKE